MDLAPDFDEFIGFLTAHGVEFVVVGAYALAFHGAPRFTGDLDILIRPTVENAARLLTALRAFGFPVTDLSPETMVDPRRMLEMGVPLRRPRGDRPLAPTWPSRGISVGNTRSSTRQKSSRLSSFVPAAVRLRSMPSLSASMWLTRNRRSIRSSAILPPGLTSKHTSSVSTRTACSRTSRMRNGTSSH